MKLWPLANHGLGMTVLAMSIWEYPLPSALRAPGRPYVLK